VIKEEIYIQSKVNSRKEEIVSAAVQQMKVKSYRGTTLQDIAQQLNITEPALYYYFSSKEKLLAEIFERSVVLTINELIKIKERPISVEEKICSVIHMYIELVANNEMMTVFFNNKGELSDENWQHITIQEKRFVGLLNEIIQEGIDQGVLKQTNLTLASFALLGMCSWIYKWYKPDGIFTVDEIAERFTDIYLQGMKQPKAK
jgi:AcrR family transcriptional regulator